jgi:hypothetical protein
VVQDGEVRWQLSVIPVWALVAVGAVLVLVLSPRAHYFTWLPIVLAGATFFTFCVQIALVRKEGLVDRVMASLGGSIVILLIATVVLGLLALA